MRLISNTIPEKYWVDDATLTHEKICYLHMNIAFSSLFRESRESDS